MLSPGTLFASRYEVLALLGQGGMGTVYRARDRELEEVVALKVLRPDVTGTKEMEERFRSEIRLARRVSHRNVCRVHDYGTAEGLHYVCMAHVEGVDLRRLLASRGPLPLDRAYDVCSQVADGLQAIHDEGIVHRDLKSANIMVDTRGVARLMDFGIAKAVDAALTHGVTATGVVVGTPEYMSPEQALGGRVDARSDIYSLGVVVFEAFTGRVPFRGETPVATILLHVQQPPPLEGTGAAGLPREVVPLLRRALAKAQADRPASARELADGLRAAWGEHAAAGAVTPTSPPTVTLSQAAPRTVRAHRWPAVSTAVAMTALVGVGVLLLARSAALRPGPGAASPGAAPSVAGLPAATPAATPTETAPSPLEARPSSAPTARTQEAAARPAATPTPASLPVPAAAAAPVAQAYLVVVVVPWADVMLDGTPVKAVPLRRLPLSPGEHVVRFVHPDYQPLQRVVTARPGETVTLTVDLPEEGVRTGK